MTIPRLLRPLFRRRRELLRDLARANVKSFGGNRILLVEFAEFYQNPVLENATIAHRDGLNVTYTFKRADVSASNLIHQLSKKYRIRDLEVRDQPIEDTIREIYEDQLLYNQTYEQENTPS